MPPIASRPYADWNEVWYPRTLEGLAKIPYNDKGYCGCSPTCSPNKPIKGIVFREHMRLKHFRGPVQKLSMSPPSSIRSAPLPQLSPSVSPRPSLPNLPGQALSFDSPLSDQGSPSLFDIPNDDDEPMYAADDEWVEGDDLLERFDVGLGFDPEGGHEDTEGDLDTSERDLPGLEEFVQQVSLEQPPSPLPYSPTSSPEPHAGPPASGPTQPSRLLDPIDGDDLVRLWPHSIPSCLCDLPAMGNGPNPYAQASSIGLDDAPPLLSRLIPLLGHSLAGHFNVPRRAIELVYRITAQTVHLVRTKMYRSFVTWYTHQHPNASPAILESLSDSLNPDVEAPIAPNTARAGLRMLDVDQNVIVHPVCPNAQCFHVFYDITSHESFSSTPLLCPSCSQSLRDKNNRPSVLHFPRRSLRAELEAAFKVPGLEEAIVRRGERKSKRDEEDHEARQNGAKFDRVYRQQDDGERWISEECMDERGDPLALSVNLSIDWANPSRSTRSGSDSMGPITLNIASLPSQLRSSFTCTLLLGITPGPRQPKGSNIYKYLLPLCLELRAASRYGFWIPTPAHPQGRLVYVNLAAVCCDRPAAIDVIGGSNFKRETTPCLRCDIHLDDVDKVVKGVARGSHEHSEAVLKQMVAIPLAIEQDRQLWRQERAADVARRAEVQKRKKDNPRAKGKGRGNARRRGATTAGPSTQDTAPADTETVEDTPMDEDQTAPVPATYTNTRRDAVIKAQTLVYGNISAVALIPGFDKFPRTIFDPMHALLEGAVKLYCYRVISAGDHAKGNDTAGDGDIGSGTDAGSDTAAERHIRQAESLVNKLGTESAADNGPIIADLRKMIEGLKKNPGKGRKLKMMPSDTLALQTLIRQVILPRSVNPLHPLWGTASAGTPTANDWRTFASTIAPLTLPLLFVQRGTIYSENGKGNAHLSSAELSALMLLFEVVTLALRSSISDIQLEAMEEKLVAWERLAFSLHPSLRAHHNLHVLLHMGEDIRNFGPVYGWWTFLVERINFIAKSTNRSGGTKDQAQVVTMRAILRARAVVSTRTRTLSHLANMDELERSTAGEVQDIFDALTSDPAANAFENVAFRYDELERSFLEDIHRYSSGTSLVKPRGRQRSGVLDSFLLHRLQDCLAAAGTLTSIVPGQLSPTGAEMPFLLSTVTFWEGVITGTRRFDCAEFTSTSYSTTVDQERASQLVRAPHGVFEMRSAGSRLERKDERAACGVLCGLFEHQMRLNGVRQPPQLYAIVRMMVPYSGDDPYLYRKHPDLNVWLWKADQLGPLRIAKMNAPAFESMLPLAMTYLPKAPMDTDSREQLWATIPVYHH